MRDRLEDWEDYLASYFGKIRLLGEIPLSRLDCEQIGGLIHALIDEYGQAGASRLLEEDYPRTFAAYLVGMGVHHYYEGGEGRRRGHLAGASLVGHVRRPPTDRRATRSSPGGRACW